MAESRARLFSIFLMACGVGVVSGLFGIGGGVLLVPLLGLLFGYEQHRAQGTSLVALVPPTGLLAFVEYYRAQAVNVPAGLLMMPGIILGGIMGSKLAQKLSPEKMRRVFAGFLFLLGLWQAVAAWAR